MGGLRPFEALAPLTFVIVFVDDCVAASACWQLRMGHPTIQCHCNPPSSCARLSARSDCHGAGGGEPRGSTNVACSSFWRGHWAGSQRAAARNGIVCLSWSIGASQGLGPRPRLAQDTPRTATGFWLNCHPHERRRRLAGVRALHLSAMYSVTRHGHAPDQVWHTSRPTGFGGGAKDAAPPICAM
jgi:hypothetical protein